MPFEGRCTENEQVNPKEVWLAIRYLDPDEKNKGTVSDIAAAVILCALVIVTCVLCELFRLKVR